MVIIYVAYFLFNYYIALIKCQTIDEEISSAILNGYDRTVTPIGEIFLDVKFYLRQLVSLEEKTQTMTTNSYIVQEWTDPRLTWLPANFSDTDKIVIQAKKLWLPELCVLNSADGDGFLKYTDQNLAILFNTGRVIFSVASNALKTRCKLNIMKFPYDRQKCEIQLASWLLSTDDIEISNVKIFMSDFIPNSNWELRNLTYFKNITNYRFIGGVDNYESDDITFSFDLKRRPLYAMINGVLPGFILNIMTFLTLFLQLNEQLKLTLKIILTSSVYSLKVSNDVPIQSDYMTYATLYFNLSLIFNFVCFIWFTLTHQMRTKKFIPKPIEWFCVFIRKHLIDRKKDEKVEPGTEEKGDKAKEEEKKPICSPVIICECNKPTPDVIEKEKQKKHIDKCLNVLNYIFQILMTLFIFITNLTIWCIVSSE